MMCVESRPRFPPMKSRDFKTVCLFWFYLDWMNYSTCITLISMRMKFSDKAAKDGNVHINVVHVSFYRVLIKKVAYGDW